MSDEPKPGDEPTRPPEEGEPSVPPTPPVTPDEPAAFEPEAPVPPPPPEEEARTVFMPFTEPPVPVAADRVPDAPREPTVPPPPVPEATQFMPPPAEPSAPPPQRPSAPPASYTAPPAYTAPPQREQTGMFTTQFAPRADGQGIQVGDVLNHIFEVKRFIARGGMGEVFEGVNVNTDERVAIKVMLPALAADPNVISMFRKEARTLTRLQHEALVQYRVLAQEPQLGVLYIVTEFVDGTNLADVLATTDASAEDLAQLLRRLAAGLRVAHALGAIHRDISPDNVLLEDGRLDKAKIIDFGIAKDLDPGSATIVGDGFAGKLNYVAPEQLGDFGRDVGPWSDVYSLALVILAVAGKRNVQMGGSLVDAVDKRRAGPDLSAAPESLRGVLDKMTRANPAERLRSMDEVLVELDGTGLTGRAPSAAAAVDGGGSGGKLPLIAGGVAAVALLAGAGWWFTRAPEAPVGGGGGGAAGGAVAAAGTPVEAARGAVNSVLPSVNCTWLDVVDVTESGKQVTVKMTGVAGNPADAQNAISRALAAAGVASSNIDFEEVATITQSGCAALDTYRTVRAPDGQKLAFAQRKFELSSQQDDTEFSGKPHANIVFTVSIDDPKADFALTGIEPSGAITPVFTSRANFMETMAARPDLISKIGDDRYRVTLPADHSGWSGMMLVTGKGPFDEKVIAPGLTARGPDWTNSFASTAANNGWQTNMVWAKNVDETPG